MSDSKTKKLFIRYLIIACVISSVNILFYTDSIIGYSIIFIQIGVLLVLLLKGDIAGYISLYLIFITNCMEYSSFTGVESQFYNLKDIRFLGLNLGAWLLLPLIIPVILHPIQITMLKRDQGDFYYTSVNLLKMNLVAFCVGAVVVLFNDNGISRLENIGREFLGMTYSMMLIPLTLTCGFIYVIQYQKKSLFRISLALQATFFAGVFQLLVAYFTKSYGYYGGVNTLLTSTLSFIIPLMLLLYFDKDYVVFPKLTFGIAILGAILDLAFNANGKMIIIFGCMIVIFVYKLFSNHNLVIKLLAIFALFCGMIAIPVLVNILAENSIIFKSKLSDVQRLFAFGNNWVSNLSESPRIRVEEYIDIFIEYINKPWLAFTGKGYMGSIKDSTGYFAQVIIKEGAFQANEWANGTFFKLHEMAQLLIIYGCWGIIYCIKLIKTAIRRQRRNIWSLLGTIWFILLYGYSFTLSVFGMSMLFLGMCDSILLDENKIMMNYENK